jgi:hypothetical protein
LEVVKSYKIPVEAPKDLIEACFEVRKRALEAILSKIKLSSLWGQADEVREVQPNNGQGCGGGPKHSDAGSRTPPKSPQEGRAKQRQRNTTHLYLAQNPQLDEAPRMGRHYLTNDEEAIVENDE